VIPVRQSVKIGGYLLSQRLHRRERFPLLVELEPLFQCNLACADCGKIQYPDEVLRRRMPVVQALDAIAESGAPMVSIAGGEPLIHPEIGQMVQAFIERRTFVYLCTNGILLEKKLDLFKPSPYFAWVVHLDGLRERHDAGVGRKGVFDKAVKAIGEAKRRGFKVTTNTTVTSADSVADVRALLDFLNDEVQVDSMMISPAFAYEQAPDQQHFPGVEEARALFGELFSDGARKRWRFNHTPLFLDFLEGKAEFDCTAWGIPCYTLFGWQRPCYLMADGYVETYAELVETTDWEKFGRGRDDRCANCLAHCGYEPTAAVASTRSPRQSLRAMIANG
jgi:hopanoid biosynthesis associated radical SAM protein HpnH